VVSLPVVKDTFSGQFPTPFPPPQQAGLHHAHSNYRNEAAGGPTGTGVPHALKERALNAGRKKKRRRVKADPKCG